MYRMKKIITDEEIILPKCMFIMKKINNFDFEVNHRVLCLNPEANGDIGEFDIGIRSQVIKYLKTPNQKMADLEQRQDQLLKKLDILYDRIKAISSLVPQMDSKKCTSKPINTSTEIVLALNPDNMPWFLNILLKDPSLGFKVSWHVHSSVPNDKINKIKAFVKCLPAAISNGKQHLRLIFKNDVDQSELKLSSLVVPIAGNVNILRFLSLVYPSVIPYDQEDYYVDSLLDTCYLLERTPDKNKETLANKIFANSKGWIYNDQFSIVDLAVYNAVKSWRGSGKCVPKEWINKAEKICA